MGPLQDTITWYKIRHTKTQTVHWDIQNLNLLRFECPSAQFAFQDGGFCTEANLDKADVWNISRLLFSVLGQIRHDY